MTHTSFLSSGRPGSGKALATLRLEAVVASVVAVLLFTSCSTPLGVARAAPMEGATASGLDAAARENPVAFLDRIGWGADAGQLDSLRQLGAARFLEDQLAPRADPALPPAAAAQLATLDAARPLDVLIPPMIAAERNLRETKRDDTAASAADAEAQQMALNKRRNELTEQAATLQLMNALYSPNQLEERLAWFWMNHFNVFRAGNVGPMLGDYYARVVKPHALGHFRDLLAATVYSPQMLLYLNNAQNARDHINENYARELMELHTLGVGGGYSQSDVTQLAGVLTGLGVDLDGHEVNVRPALRNKVWRNGLVLFHPGRHDAAAKRVLGREFRGDTREEINRIIDVLATSPVTARRISSLLADYFCGGAPPELVDAMAQRWAETSGDIAAVLRTMFASAQFAHSLSRPQFKDPMRYVLSAARAGFDGRTVVNARPLLGMLNRLGEPMYGRQTPDGYPLDRAAWDGPGQMTARFDVARQFAGGAPMLFVVPQSLPSAAPTGAMADDTVATATMMSATSVTATRSAAAASTAAPPATPATARIEPPAFVRSAVYLAAEPQLSSATRHTLAQADNRFQWNALWLSSPEFMND
jgi:uncharacterized protein (DUF1800 family)